MTQQNFYKMLTEIHNEVADMSDGCMGSNYTPESVELRDTYEEKFDLKDKQQCIQRIPSTEPSDYIGNIIRKYIKIEGR